MKYNSNWRIAGLALVIFVLDRLSKLAVMKFVEYGTEGKEIVPGFFKLVYWTNTGAAWSFFRGNNAILAGVAVLALVILVFVRHHFDIHTAGGQISLGLIFGGILGNLTDRMLHHHVIDFLYFYVNRRDGVEVGFPAFNVADSAICTGVGLLFLLSLRQETTPSPAAETKP
jgi:signal peptidase II